MNKQTLVFIALAITIVYGGLFAVIGDGARTTYAVIGAIVVALAWLSVGMLTRDDDDRPHR